MPLSKISLISGVLGASLVSFGIFHGYFLFLLSGLVASYLFYKSGQSDMLKLNVIYSLVNINGIIQFFVI